MPLSLLQLLLLLSNSCLLLLLLSMWHFEGWPSAFGSTAWEDICWKPPDFWLFHIFSAVLILLLVNFLKKCRETFPRAPAMNMHCTENSNKYSHKWNCAASFPISKFIYLQLAICCQRADTRGKCAAVINDTSGQLAVLLILVVHLELRVSSWICQIIRNGPNRIIRSLGEDVHEKNLK